MTFRLYYVFQLLILHFQHN